MTRPAKVLQGMVEFEEKLTLTCLVYGSQSGPHYSAKYEAKYFFIEAPTFPLHMLGIKYMKIVAQLVHAQIKQKIHRVNFKQKTNKRNKK